MSALRIETHGAVRLIALNEPDSRNALSPAIRAGLEREIPAFFADPALRVLLLTGTGSAFCAGGDLAGLANIGSAAEMEARMHRAGEWLLPLLAGDKLVMTAINGPAVGAGLGLALLGDIRVASEAAVFMAGFAAIGLVPDFGVCVTLPEAVGAALAKDMLMLNLPLNATEAAQHGLVSRVLPAEGFEAAALRLATQLAAAPSGMVRATRRLMAQGREPGIADYLRHEAAAQGEALMSDDAREGIAAFLAKRRPRFNQTLD